MKSLHGAGSHHVMRSPSHHSQHNSSWRRTLLETNSNDQAFDPSDFEDVRCEIQATGYHLTSVLMNPRETLLDNIFDEFAAEQSLPLEYQSSLSIGSNSLFSPSTHSTFHSSTHTSIPTSTSSQGNGTVVLSLTATETEQMNRFIRKMQQVFKIYLGAHGAEVLQKALFPTNPGRKIAETTSPRGNRQPKKSSAEELALCYIHVPDLFFRPDFSLMKQEMFNQVISPSVPSDKYSHQQRHNASEVAQEKLSYYLDLVEVALLRQIWSRSPAFFRALDNLKGLQHDVHDAIKELKQVRYRMYQLSEHSVAPAMKIPSIHKRHQNSLALQTKLEQMTLWIQGRANILVLLEVEDYFSAHELLFFTKRIYNEHLKGIQAIKPLALQLKEIEAGVNEVLCNKFVTMAIQWTEASPFLDSNGKNPVGGNNQSGKSVSALDFYLDELTTGIQSTKAIDRRAVLIQEQHELCTRLLHSLVANEALLPALNLYKNRLIDGLKLIIRTCVMEYISNFDPTMGMDDSPWEGGSFESFGEGSLDNMRNSGGNGNTPYVQRIRDMSTENFLSCLSMCFEHIMTSLKKAEDFHSVLVRNLSTKAETNKSSIEDLINDDISSNGFGNTPKYGGSTGENTPSNSAVSEAMKTLDDASKEKLTSFSKAVLQNACDVVQKNVAQLINYRRDINAKFEPYRMKFLWEISLTFVLCLENCAASTATVIRQCLQTQTKAFLEYLHESYKNRMVSTLDSERWVQCDVTAERQREIDRLSSGKAFLVANNNSSSSTPSGGLGVGSAPGSSAEDNSGIVKKKEKDSRPAVVDGVDYRIVWSVLLLVEIVLGYLDIAFHFPPVTPDVISKIVEQVRLFNIRTNQLVLGAQAIQSAARLKSISAKHLAIAGRSLALFIALLPHIRAALVAQIPPKHQVLLTEMDRVSHDLFEHHTAIVAKFVSIVGDTIEASAIKLRQVDWDRSLANNSSSHGGEGEDSTHSVNATPNISCEYFEEMARNISTLHKVLLTILPPEQIQDVFFRIFGLLNRRVPAHFEEIMPSSVAGRQRILDEVTHLVSTLARLKHVDATILTGQLEESMRKKFTRV
jgi:vacuolar protein sorting-associated protein 54